MNQMHPDTRFEIHRSYQNDRLAHSLQEKPESEPRSFKGSKWLILIIFLAVGCGAYVVIV